MPEGNDYDKINKSITKQDLNYLLGLLFDANQTEDSTGQELNKESGDRSDGKHNKPTAIDRPDGKNKPTAVDRPDGKDSKSTAIDKPEAKTEEPVKKVDSGGKHGKSQKSIDSLKPSENLGKISRVISPKPLKLNTKSNIKLVSAIREKLRESTKDANKYPVKRKTSSRLSLLGRLRGRESDVSLEQMNAEASYFTQHLQNCVNNSVALRQSSPPFDCHPDLLKRYLAHAHQIFTNYDDTCELTPIVLKFIVLDASLSPAKGDRYDPYFKVYLPGKLNGKQAHKSKHFHNELSPKWNESFQVPVTRKDIQNKESIRIELWDHDPSTVCGALAECRTMKSPRHFYKRFKDVLEVLFSSLPRVQIDDKIGLCWVRLDEIPATGCKLTKAVEEKRSKVERGTIRMHIDWGFVKMKNKKEKLVSILMHMKLYASCLNLHLSLEHNETVEQLKIEKISYVRLFYVSELTLINQSRLRGCLTEYEDGILRRAVIVRTILRLPTERRNERLLLSSMLCNEDLSTPESLVWIDSGYLRELREFEVYNLGRLARFYTTRFDAFKCLCFSKAFECETLDVLQFLRTIVKYEKCYPDARFEVKVNFELRNYVLNLIGEMLTDPSQWTQLANKLDFLDENLEKYWQRGIQRIMDRESLQKIRNDYERTVYGLVSERVAEWSDRRSSSKEKIELKSLDNQLISWYFFCKKFEFIIFGPIEQVQSVDRLDPSIRRSADAIEKREEANLPAPRTIQPQSANQLAKSSSNDFGQSGANLRASASQEEREADSRLIDVNNLTFCDLIQIRPINLSLAKVFPQPLFESWMSERVENCLQLSAECASREIKQLIKAIKKKRETVDGLKSSYSTVENYFYEALTETVYFYTSLQHYDEQLFERTIDKFCECLHVFVVNYKSAIVSSYKSLSDVRRTVLLIAIGINELCRLNDKLLNRIFIQILTDVPAQEVWSCIEKHRAAIRQKGASSRSETDAKNEREKSVRDKSEREKIERNDQREKPEKTSKKGRSIGDAEMIESLNNATSRLIVKTCFRIKYTVDQISDLINGLVQLLGKQILIEFEIGLNEVLNSKDVARMFRVVDQLDLTLKQFTGHLANQQSQLDLIYFTKHNIDLNLKIVFLDLCDQYVEELREKLPARRLTKIKAIKLVNIFHKLKELFAQKADSFDEPCKRLLSKSDFLNQFYVDTEEFTSLTSRLFNI